MAGGYLVEPGEGPGHLEAVLDALARVDFDASGPGPNPPVDPAGCVLVSVDAAPGFGDVMAVGRGAKLDRPADGEDAA